jgi:Voltage-dependent anion channel
VPITYTPMLWSLVFPLGMYALASLRLSLASDFPPLRAVLLAMVWIALAVWAGTCGDGAGDVAELEGTTEIVIVGTILSRSSGGPSGPVPGRE